jgi:quercetin dioxygenase-like cupin family protein
MFPVTRVYSDKNGDTKFEDIHMPLKDAGEIGKLSKGVPVTSIIFREVEASYDYDFHNAPQKQYLILIDGGIKIETTLGEKRQFQTGDVLLLEDTEGKGHRTKNLEPRKRKSVFITLA